MPESNQRKRRPKPVLGSEQQAEKEQQAKLRRFEREVNRKLNSVIPDLFKLLEQNQK